MCRVRASLAAGFLCGRDIPSGRRFGEFWQVSANIASDLWIIGAGRMGGFYADVAQNLDRELSVIGRGEESAAKFTDDKGIECRPGGIEAALEAAGRGPDNAVVATNVETLASVCRALMAAGTKNILVEKPGGNGLDEIEALAAKDIGALADLLGEQVWFHGDRVSTTDACVYSLLANIAFVEFESPMKAMIACHTNLTAWLDRFRSEVYP